MFALTMTTMTVPHGYHENKKIESPSQMHTGVCKPRFSFYTKRQKKKRRAKRKDEKRRFFAKPAPLALLAIRTPLKLDVADCMFIVSFFFFCRRYVDERDCLSA